ncbi:MAG: hypothetical protein BGP16_04155 [Sphingobium sp. 66-54]|nr:MAG: hypothetical protein BGP16_04155 [Sphingobium sp. 66-54]
MGGLQPGGIGGADQGVGTVKKDGRSTGSVSARGKLGAGQRTATGRTGIGRGRGEAQHTSSIVSAGSINLAIGIIVQSPVPILDAGDLGPPAGIGTRLCGFERGSVRRAQGSLGREGLPRAVQPGTAQHQRCAQAGNGEQRADP